MWSEEVFVIKIIRNTVPWTYAISDLDDEKLVGNSMKNQSKLPETSLAELRVEKVIKKKGNRLCKMQGLW